MTLLFLLISHLYNYFYKEKKSTCCNAKITQRLAMYDSDIEGNENICYNCQKPC